MASRGLLLAFVLASLVALVVGFAGRSRTVVAPVGVSAAAEAADRHVRRSRLAGLVLGLLAAIALWNLDALGRGAMLGAVGFGLVFMAASCVGELTSPLATSASAEADLRHRVVSDYLPRGLTTVVGTSVGLLVALLLVGISTAASDDLGRSGRSLSWSTPDGSSTVGPWPGSFYAGPLLAALAVEVVVAELVLRVIARRAQVVASEEGHEADTALRGVAARGVVAAVGVATGFPLLGVGLVMAVVPGGEGAPTWLALVRWLAALAALSGLVTFCLSCAALLRSSAAAVVEDRRDERAEDLTGGPA
jgi:hypothetical protein